MTSEGFRRIALSLPETAEGEHLEHPDFRVCGKIFATLMPEDVWGVLMLSPEQQLEWLHSDPKAFVPAKGAWGRRGCTQVRLQSVKASTLRKALTAAWRHKAPDDLVAGL